MLCYPKVIQSVVADPGFVSLIPARPLTFVEIDHEIFSMVILLLLLIQEVLLSVTMKVFVSLPREKFGEVN